MDENLGLMPDTSVIYIPNGQHESVGVAKHDYMNKFY